MISSEWSRIFRRRVELGFGSLVVVFLTSALSPQTAAAGMEFEPWRIVSASDWHSAEDGVLSNDPQTFRKNQDSEALLIKGTVACRPDVVLIAGDVGSGHWTESALKKSGVLKPSESIEAAINRLGEKTYRTMKQNFLSAGVERLWVCVGDHGIGDNDWGPGTERSRNVPYHRSVFGRSFNMDTNGKWLWPEMVCGVPARPMRTPYQDTSFAVRHKNALFVIVDIFRQERPDEILHTRHGSVSPDLAGDHLVWFERVLKAGRKDPEVKYIFVQAHTPALPPVRAQSSSMMMADGYDQSNLWSAMRHAKVDLYFAGEVHATTVSKDPSSDVVQVVTDRKLPTLITVYEDKITLQAFDRTLQPNGSPKKDALYEEHRLTILKQNGETKFTDGHGVLKPLDTRSLFIHYPFEKIETTPFPSTKYNKTTTILNHGDLDCTYDARTDDSRLVEGKQGKGLQLGKRGFVDVHGTGPFGLFDRVERTMSLWFKTDQPGEYNLICGGNGLNSKDDLAVFMDLLIAEGVLKVRTNLGEISTEGPKLNDGKWHHAALVVLPDAEVLDDVQVYVDGERRGWDPTIDKGSPVKTKMAIYGISVGGSHRPVWANSKRKKGVVSFPGQVDDFACWYRALSAAEVRQLYRLADSDGLNASQVDKIFRTSD